MNLVQLRVVTLNEKQFSEMYQRINKKMFSLDHKRRSRKRNQKKWKRSDSSDSDSVELMTPLTTPIFDFHKVIRSLTTPTTTPSLLKTSLMTSQPSNESGSFSMWEDFNHDEVQAYDQRCIT